MLKFSFSCYFSKSHISTICYTSEIFMLFLLVNACTIYCENKHVVYEYRHLGALLAQFFCCRTQCKMASRDKMFTVLYMFTDRGQEKVSDDTRKSSQHSNVFVS